MMTIDPRLADRRREVAEDRARRSINRILRLLALIALIGGSVWLLLSPTFSVEALDVSGVQSSDTRSVLSAHKVVEGRPLILIRSGAVEAQLLEDPWVKEASVVLDWPRRVVVAVTERTPVAWVETGGGWARRAVDGAALPGESQPDDTMGHIRLESVSESDAEESRLVLGSLEFIDTLPVSLGSDAVIEVRSTELWAVVGGFEVRLGRPVEMADKALSLATLLLESLEEGSLINMIAPTNPAVVAPGALDGPDPATGDGGAGQAGEDGAGNGADDEGEEEP
ncbi:MAG: FtsQ-type POTRA domain-containing protein [Acidimicrobiia bacterium]